MLKLVCIKTLDPLNKEPKTGKIQESCGFICREDQAQAYLNGLGVPHTIQPVLLSNDGDYPTRYNKVTGKWHTICEEVNND